MALYPFRLSQVRRPIEKLALRAKGLREALCVRCLEAEQEVGGGVFYRLRVEDVETGGWWLVSKRYRDCASLRAQLAAAWPPAHNLAFPAKVRRQTYARRHGTWFGTAYAYTPCLQSHIGLHGFKMWTLAKANLPFFWGL